MATNIYMPALSPTMTEGSLTKWLVKIGDNIKSGDILAEIETDKATMEVEAVDEGIITNLMFKEGANEIAVNSVIAVLDGDESIDILKNENHDSNITKKLNNKISKENKVSVLKKDEDINIVKKEIITDIKNKIIASPYVKKISKDKNINLTNIAGTGTNNRIIKRDIMGLGKIETIKKFSQENIIEPSSIRKIIAERTTFTKQNVPHFYLKIESDVDKLLLMREKINKEFNSKISINDILVKALAEAQKLNPSTNAYWDNQKIIKNNTIDVSIAVALDEGLITPIIKDADKKGLIEISNEIRELAQKAKKGKLLPDEYNGGSISISNLGMLGISEFSAIINPPQSCILAVGAIIKLPRFINDKIIGVNILKSTLSADHRILDGAIAAKLLKDFNDIIENPFTLWLNSKDMQII